MAFLSIIEIPSPIVGLPLEDIQARVKAIFKEVVEGLTQTKEGEKEAVGKIVVKPEPEVFIARGSSNTEALYEAHALFYQENRNDKLTDGFPIIPPTLEAVERMLKGTKRDPDEVIGEIPPKQGKATIRKIAINAVMAGAEPAYMPVVITAVEAILDPLFASTKDMSLSWGVRGMQSTTAVATPLLIINGPIAKKLDVNWGVGCLGRGFRANATIGRALRLILTNIGGAQPGLNDMKSTGSAQELTFCLAEKEDYTVFNRGEKSWKLLNVEKGYSPDTSTVTAFPAWPPVSVEDGEHCGPEILNAVADSMTSLGQVPYLMDVEYVLILGLTHARCLADAGFSKDDIREYLYANTQMPWRKYKQQYPGISHRQPPWMANITDDATTVHIYGSPENVNVIVAGGESPYSLLVRAHFPGVTKPIVEFGD